MLRFLPAPIVGIIALLLYTLNTLFWSFVLFFIAIFLIIPIKSWRRLCHKAIHMCPLLWMDCNNGILWLTTRIEWDVQGLEKLKRDDWYLVISNHQSWSDIIVLMKVFHRKIPLLKFFMKRELLWQFPFAAQACWIMGYPFMVRYSKSFLKKHPELKGKDLETTRKSCEKFKSTPTSVISFVEGTRFTKEKQQRQQSPFQYLLRPKAGGMAFVLGTMGEYLNKIIDVTLIYPNTSINMWDFLCGRIKKIIVRTNTHDITPDLIGDYQNNREYRTYLQTHLNEMWQMKDDLIKECIRSEKL